MYQEPGPIIVCRECDLLQREIPVPEGSSTKCRRCGAILYRNVHNSLGHTLAFAITAFILFVTANVYPIVGIEMQGNQSATNLYGAMQSLWSKEKRSMAALVSLTTIIIPAIELTMMIYLLLPLIFHRAPAGAAAVMRTIAIIEPWGMVDVFMLGILVSLIKLSNSFSIIYGVALWSFGGLTFMFAAMTASFNPRDVWDRLDECSGKEALV